VLLRKPVDGLREDFLRLAQTSQQEGTSPEAFPDSLHPLPKLIASCILNIPSQNPDIVSNMVVVGRIWCCV
jgi:hypothetical protein